MKPRVCILKTDGVNCDEETIHAFNIVGGCPELVHINQLRNKEKKLAQYHILALPGGFSYGDDIASGKILATELTSYFSDQLQNFVNHGKPIIGICNGFQVLVRTGLLPNQIIGKQQVTLAKNEMNRFECRWIDLAIAQSICKFICPEEFAEQLIPMHIAHGEGRFFGNKKIIQELINNKQIVFRYTQLHTKESISYPHNPNGSMENIAGICDSSGLILGMMPHPERSIASFHPYRKRTQSAQRAAITIFQSLIRYAQEM